MPLLDTKRVLSAMIATLVLVGHAPAAGGASQPPGVRVIGGTPASTEDFPWMIALADAGIARPSGQFCGGALVAPTKVVTAAHCVARYQFAPQLLHLIGGRTDMRIADGTVRVAVDIWVHPSYSPSALTADFAVITLNRPMPYQPLQIALASDSQLYRPGRAALTLGWGVTSETDQGAKILQQVHLPVVSDEDCAAQYPSGDPAFPPFVQRAHTCAGYNADNTGVAGGDSGGPLVVAGVLAGVTSTRNLGEPTDAGIFTRLDSYADEVIGQIENDSRQPAE